MKVRSTAEEMLSPERRRYFLTKLTNLVMMGARETSATLEMDERVLKARRRGVKPSWLSCLVISLNSAALMICSNISSTSCSTMRCTSLWRMFSPLREAMAIEAPRLRRSLTISIEPFWKAIVRGELPSLLRAEISAPLSRRVLRKTCRSATYRAFSLSSLRSSVTYPFLREKVEAARRWRGVSPLMSAILTSAFLEMRYWSFWSLAEVTISQAWWRRVRPWSSRKLMSTSGLVSK
mmetsp:Transcript_43676/g.72731  ORF Transcript_43676/g.72731 Transcript_43676/m.72731 type:complete len:236 (+) Transcript_43676:3560-4267(+)